MVDTQMVLGMLDKVAEKLGVKAEFMWAFLVKQQLVEAYVSLGALVVFGILFVFQLSSIFEDDPFPYNRTTIKDQTRCVFFIVSCIALVISIIATIINGMNFFNAEYFAFKDLVNLLSKFK
jgi:hypothetical protein